MHKIEKTRKNYRDIRNDQHLVKIKITGDSTQVVAEIQDLISESYGDRAILSPIMRSQPSGFHAFVSVREE